MHYVFTVLVGCRCGKFFAYYNVYEQKCLTDMVQEFSLDGIR